MYFGRLFVLWGVLCSALSAPSAAVSDETVSATLAHIREHGTISIGYRQEAWPFSFEHEGRPTGYTVELCLELVEELARHLDLPRIQVEFVPVPAASRFILMGNGAIQLECSTTTNTAQRREMVEFSYPIFYTSNRFVSLADADFEGVEDLAGRSVASTTGTINIKDLNQLNRERNMNIAVVVNRTHPEGFDLVAKGRVAAFVMDDVILASLIAGSETPGDYVISQDTLRPSEPYGILYPLGDRPFRDLANTVLEDIYASGRAHALYEKWFLSSTSPDGLTLNLPLSEALSANFDAPVPYGNPAEGPRP